MADTKVSALSDITPAATDYLYIVDDPSGTPASARCNVEEIWGSWKKLGSSSPSGASQVEFTGLDSTYRAYAVSWSNLQTSSDGEYLLMQVAPSTTYVTSGYSGGISFSVYHSVSMSSTSGTSAFVPGGSTGTAAGEASSGIAYLFDLCNAEYTMMMSRSNHIDAAGNASWGVGGGFLNTTTVYDRFKIYWGGSATIDDGEVCLWGLDGFA